MQKKAMTEAEIDGLYKLIDTIYGSLHEIRGEARGIADNADIPDAALHLRDVLQSTEDATMDILQSANEIAAQISNGDVPGDVQSSVMAHIGKIIESCSFQDLSGQRIKRVLKLIDDLQEQLLRLSRNHSGSSAPVTSIVKPKNADPLMNGPQLTANTPSQSDVDSMFSKEN
jgi:chemotaxis protein CheZ